MTDATQTSEGRLPSTERQKKPVEVRTTFVFGREGLRRHVEKRLAEGFAVYQTSEDGQAVERVVGVVPAGPPKGGDDAA